MLQSKELFDNRKDGVIIVKGIINLKAVFILIVWFLALNALGAMWFCLEEKSWLIHWGYYALVLIFIWVTIKLFPEK